MKVTEINFKSRFEKLLVGLVEGDDIQSFFVDKEQKKIQILVGDWSLELDNNGKWDIT